MFYHSNIFIFIVWIFSIIGIIIGIGTFSTGVVFTIRRNVQLMNCTFNRTAPTTHVEVVRFPHSTAYRVTADIYYVFGGKSYSNTVKLQSYKSEDDALDKLEIYNHKCYIFGKYHPALRSKFVDSVQRFIVGISLITVGVVMSIGSLIIYYYLHRSNE